MIKVSVIGSGNVAHHLIKILSTTKEIEFIQAFARNKNALAALLPSEKIINNYDELLPADIYIISVSDNAIKEVSEKIPHKNSLVVHTSGSVSYDNIVNKARRGVFYPLQTFSKNKPLDFLKIPICIEASSKEDLALLEEFAKKISNNVHHINQEQRKSLHVSAVFVCNFVNYLYGIGKDICDEYKVPFKILLPLILETAQKIETLSPKEAQTGPALRNDTITLNNHIEFLENSPYQNLYKELTEHIRNAKKL